MISKWTRERYEKLKAEVNRHRRLYYVEERPEISDSAYDELEQELVRLEAKFPELITPQSPTQRVGGEPAAGFKKVPHRVAQWSFNDAFTEKDMREWDARVRNILGRSDLPGKVRPSQYVSDTRIPLTHIFFGKRVVERPLRHPVRHFFKSGGRFTPHPLGGALGRYKFGELRLKPHELLLKLVVGAVGNFRALFNIIEPAVAIDLRFKLFVALASPF